MTGNVFIAKVGAPETLKRADTFDKEYLALCVLSGKKDQAVVNDELLEDGSMLITVTTKAWKEMSNLVR